MNSHDKDITLGVENRELKMLVKNLQYRITRLQDTIKTTASEKEVTWRVELGFLKGFIAGKAEGGKDE